MLAEVQLSAASPSATQIDSDNLEPDGLIIVRTFRDTTDSLKSEIDIVSKINKNSAE